MSIQAKVSPLAQSVNSAAPIAIPDNGILTLTQSSNIVLDIAPESVTSYTKSGADLIVQLKSGESLRIANFYVEGQPVSQLYLVDRDKLLAVDLPRSLPMGRCWQVMYPRKLRPGSSRSLAPTAPLPGSAPALHCWLGLRSLAAASRSPTATMAAAVVAAVTAVCRLTPRHRRLPADCRLPQMAAALAARPSRAPPWASTATATGKPTSAWWSAPTANSRFH
nr:BapA prefix-like domain-containing protein [Pseudomonas asiatica]